MTRPTLVSVPSPSRRRASAVVALAGVLSLGTAGALAHADAAPRAYQAVASAYAFDTTASNASIPVGLVVEGAGPVAQASQNSLPDSAAFASFPYPGDTAAGLLPTVTSLYGIQAPGYPLIARSTINDKEPQTANYPGIELTASSGDKTTSASAVAGTSASGGTANSRIVASGDSSLLAEGIGHINALDVGGLFTVTGVTSTARVTVDSDGVLKKYSSLVIAGFDAPGLRVKIPKTTPGFVPVPNPIPGLPAPALNLPVIPLPLGGQTLDQPKLGFEDGSFTIQLPGFGATKFGLPAQAALDALKGAGITVTYQASQETADSITAPALNLKYSLPAPPSNQYFNGPTAYDLALGRSNAQIQAQGITPATPVDAGTGGGSVLPVGSDAGGLPAVAPSDGGMALAPGIGTGPLDTSGGSVLPSGDGAVAAPDLAGPVAASPLAPLLSANSPLLQAETYNASWVYVLFVALALAAFGAASVLRLVGVRAQWMS